MYYFKYGETEIEKYEVLYEKERIEAFKNQVIENCSEIEHYEYDGTNGPNEFDYIRIRNFSKIRIGIREFNDFYSLPETLYHFIYDEYKYPYLVTLVDKLLSNDPSSINEILNPNFKLEKEPLDIRIKKASEILDSINNLDINKKKRELEELEKLVKLAKLNQYQKPVKNYYEMLQSLITLKHIDTLTTDEHEKVNNFFNKTKPITYEKQLKV